MKFEKMLLLAFRPPRRYIFERPYINQFFFFSPSKIIILNVDVKKFSHPNLSYTMSRNV